MQKIFVVLLVTSVVLLNVIFLASAHSFLALYYILWLGGVGRYLWNHQEHIEERIVKWNIGSFKKFLLLGIMMILCEETFAGISMHLATARGVGDIVVGIFQFWAFNLLALPGIVIGWYFLLSRYVYTRKEVFVLVGFLGLFAEKTLIYLVASPLMGVLLVLPTMCTYALIIAPSVLSFRTDAAKEQSRLVRYVLGVVVPIVVSVPFIGLLMYLKTHFPGVFPPAGFVS